VVGEPSQLWASAEAVEAWQRGLERRRQALARKLPAWHFHQAAFANGERRWFAAACNLPPGETDGTARVGAGETPLEAMETLHERVMAGR
jgi:hypothetical protein